MSYGVKQTRRFARAYKKIHANVLKDVNAAVAAIAEDPSLGVQKKGDLSTLFVHKFRSQNQLYLLGYTREDEVRLIYLEAIGSHENFYRDVKR